MSRPVAPVLTVRSDGSQRTFAAGHDVVVGRDLRADVRVAHPLISRAHLVLRYDHGRWMAIDNGSLNGMFVNGRRLPAVDITDRMTVNIGNPDGPALSFELGRDQGSVGRPPPTSSVRVAAPPSTPSWPAAPSAGQSTASSYAPPSQSRQPAYPPPRSQPTYHPPTGPAPAAPTQMRPVAVKPGGSSNLATSMLKILRPGGAPAEVPPGAVKIGRATDNDIVIPDVLASRHHATLIPTPGGTEIADNRSINGTFVNGARVDTALLDEGDVVTIGNVDLLFTRGTLVRRTETEAATATGGLDVRAVTWTIENHKTLLDNISLTARPGTLTAGAQKAAVEGVTTRGGLTLACDLVLLGVGVRPNTQFLRGSGIDCVAQACMLLHCFVQARIQHVAA